MYDLVCIVLQILFLCFVDSKCLNGEDTTDMKDSVSPYFQTLQSSSKKCKCSQTWSFVFEIYSRTLPYSHLVNTVTSLLRPFFLLPAKHPYIFL